MVPHYLVRMAMRAMPRALLVRTLIAPKRIPAQLPAGCLRKEQLTVVEEVSETGEDGEQRLRRWLEAAEGIWCDVMGKEGKEKERVEGRAEGARFKWKSALGTPGNPVPHSTKVSRSWTKIAGWCATIKQARKHEGARKDCGHPLAAAAQVARRRVMAAGKWKWDEGEEKETLARFVESFRGVGLWWDNGELAALAAWAETEAEGAVRRAAEDSTRRYKEWLQGGSAGGLSRQHGASKVRGQWVPGKMVKERAVDEDGITHVVGQWEGEVEEDGLKRLVATVHTREEGLMTPADVQQEVDEEGRKWASVWAAAEEVEACQWPLEIEELPDIGAHQILEAAGTFKDEVGLGWDRLHPKALRRLPEGMLTELGKIFKEAEKKGVWGKHIGVVITALIPKGGGGWRPIGLLPTLIRLWARVRAGIVQRWEAENDREYLYGGRGKGAMVAAWKCAARAEAVRLQKGEYAAVLLDLEKAFDRVPHHQVVTAARQWGYPLGILRLSLASYRLRRVVGVGGVFSDEILPKRGLAAGSTHATRELRALMIGIFDHVQRMVGSAIMTVYVDDSTLEFAGTLSTVQKAAVEATESVCLGFEACELVLSQTKNKVVASRRQLGQAIQEGLKRWRVKWCATGKMLGVGSAAAIRRTTEVTAERVAEFARRRGQFGRLRRLGVDIARLLRTGGMAGVQYGQAILGVADYQLLQLRRRAAGLVGGMTAGKDPNLVLIVADARMGDMADPAFAAHADPVVNWAEAVWEGRMALEWMQKTVARAKVELTKARRQWAVVKGPAAAVVATLARLGWTMIDAVKVYTDKREEVDFQQDPPARVKQLIHESVRRWRWRLAGMVVGEGREGWTDGPVWKPLADLISKGRWTDPVHGPREDGVVGLAKSGEQAALRSALVGGQWPQVRLHVAGLVEEPYCVLCRAQGVETLGTLTHRIYECSRVEHRVGGSRPHEIDQDWKLRGRGGGGSMREGEGSMEWERALVQQPRGWAVRREETFEWLIEPEGIVSGVNVYVDGSMFDAFEERFTTLGWAFAVVKEGKVMALARGTPPPHVRTIPAAEGWALAMAVERVEIATAIFFTDCKAVRALARAGRRRATSARNINARVWCVLYTRTDNMSPNVEWIPAHLGKERIGVARIGDGTLLTQEQWEMNALVDEHAKVAAGEGRKAKEEVEAYRRVMRKVAVAAAWIGKATYAANNGQEEPRRDAGGVQRRAWSGGDEGGRKVRKRKRLEVARLSRPTQLGGHELRVSEGGWVCTVCWRFTRSRNRMVTERCGGSAAGFWARRAVELGGYGGSDGAGHVRAAYGDLVWCVRCGSYAIKWAIGLAGPCRGAPTNPSQLRVWTRLKAGRHPRTNAHLRDGIRMEVHGMKLQEEEEGLREVGGGGMIMMKGRSTAGYLRRPGGRTPVQGERTLEERMALAAEQWGTEGGPRQRYIARRRISRMELMHCEEDGDEERLQKRRRASRAMEEESMEEEALTAKYIAAMGDDQAREEGGAAIEGLLSKRKAAMKEGSEVREAEAREGMVEKTGVAEAVRGGHAVAEAVAAGALTRKALVEELKRRAARHKENKARK